MTLTPEILIAIMPSSASAYSSTNHNSRAAVFCNWLNTWMPQYDITEILEVAFFLATIAVESMELSRTEEIASGAAYDTGHLAQVLGNTPWKDGDGQKYKGRGLIQLTGRNNYVAYSEHVGYDFYTSLSRARGLAQPGNATRSACWYWKSRKIKRLCTLDTKDNREKIRRSVNGGLNGYKQFSAYADKAIEVLTAA